MKMKTNLELQKELKLRDLYLKRFEKGNFVDIQRIKYEIRKVKNRKNNNKLEVISKKREGKIILIINGNEVLEMEYKKGLGKLLVDITLELEHQMEVYKFAKESKNKVLYMLQDINEKFIIEI